MKICPELESLNLLAMEIMTAARTAPKTRGIDTLITALVEKDDIEQIVNEMNKLYNETKKELFKRDSQNLIAADSCILFSIKNAALGLNCGACGMDCAELTKAGIVKNNHYNGPNCMYKSMDLGIALGSAVKRASELCIDNRIMYSIGLAAKRAKLIDGDIVMALPLSVKGKNIFFDRIKK